MNESDALISLKMLIVSEVARERELLRLAASQASVPIDVIEIENAGDRHAACDALAKDPVDAIFLDSRMPKLDRQAVVDAARAVPGHPLVILIGAADMKTRVVLTDGLTVDGALAKPIDVEETRALIDGCVRARLPNRALIVDDSSTVRAVVRKVLMASRFRFETDEAEDGTVAIEKAGKQRFDIVFLDLQMPGIDGWATLAELQRRRPEIKVVMITGTNDAKLVARAHAAGAKELLYKPFYAKDIDGVLNRMFGLMKTREN